MANTELHIAAAVNGNLATVKRLLEAEASQTQSRGRVRMVSTPPGVVVLYASDSPNCAAIVEFLLRGGAKVNCRGEYGGTPLRFTLQLFGTWPRPNLCLIARVTLQSVQCCSVARDHSPRPFLSSVKPAKILNLCKTEQSLISMVCLFS